MQEVQGCCNMREPRSLDLEKKSKPRGVQIESKRNFYEIASSPADRILMHATQCDSF